MVKLRSTLHEVAWQCDSLAYSSGLIFGQVMSAIAFRSLFSSNWLSKKANYIEIVLKHFFNNIFTFCTIGLLDKSRVATLAFLKPDFEILAFFEHLWIFLEIKKSLTKSGFFQSERLGSGKTLSELHIH